MTAAEKKTEENFGSEIKRLRLEAGLSQKRVGELAGVSRRSIQNWEKGLRKPFPLVESVVISILREQAEHKEKSGGDVLCAVMGEPAAGKGFFRIEKKKGSGGKHKLKPFIVAPVTSEDVPRLCLILAETKEEAEDCYKKKTEANGGCAAIGAQAYPIDEYAADSNSPQFLFWLSFDGQEGA